MQIYKKTTLALISMLVFSGCETLKLPEPAASPTQISAQVEQLIRLGDKTRDSGDLVNAAGFYQKAYTLQPTRSQSLILLAETVKQTGDIRGAETLYRDALSKHPEDSELLRRYANTLIQLDKLPTALIQLERAHELAPNDARILNSQGVALDLQNRHEDAQEKYQAALTLTPDNLDTLNNYALSLALAEKYDEAITQIVQYGFENTSPQRLKMNLALFYGLKGDEENARKVAAQVLDNKSVDANLAYYKSLRALAPSERSQAILRP